MRESDIKLDSLTRRGFLKVVTAATVLPSAMGFSSKVSSESIKSHRFECKSCGSVNFTSVVCFGCGSGMALNAGSRKDLDIPFPNKNWLIDTPKPSFSLSSLNF